MPRRVRRWGSSCARLGDPRGAIAALDAAVRLDPRNARALVWMGMVQTNAGRGRRRVGRVRARRADRSDERRRVDRDRQRADEPARSRGGRGGAAERASASSPTARSSRRPPNAFSRCRRSRHPPESPRRMKRSETPGHSWRRWLPRMDGSPPAGADPSDTSWRRDVRRRGSKRSARAPASTSSTTRATSSSTICRRSWAAAPRCSTWTTTASSTCISCRAVTCSHPVEHGSRQPAVSQSRRRHVRRRDRTAAAPAFAATAWASTAGDFDNDGYTDLYVTNLRRATCC